MRSRIFEWFTAQDRSYQDLVIPPAVKARVSVEAGVPMGWREIVGDSGEVIGTDHFGASAAGSVLFEQFGFTPTTSWQPPMRQWTGRGLITGTTTGN
jgi:transketolase